MRSRAISKLKDPRVKGKVRGFRNQALKYRGLGVTETYLSEVFKGKAEFRKNYLYFYKEVGKNNKTVYRDLSTGRFMKKPKTKGVILNVK